MSSEINILKKIGEKRREVSLRQVSNESGFGADYVRYVINSLIKKNFVISSKKKRDWFKLTAQGEKRLATREIPKEEMKKTPRKKRHEQNKIVLVHNLSEDQTKQELHIGGAMEKAARLLKGFRAVLSSFKDKNK